MFGSVLESPQTLESYHIFLTLRKHGFILDPGYQGLEYPDAEVYPGVL